VQLELSYAARAPWVPTRREFARWIEAVPAPAGKRACATRAGVLRTILFIRVVGLARSRSLNLRYRRKDRATNVLSFAGAGHLPDGKHVLGELVICAPLVAAEARRQNKTIRAHWAHLTVHGILHLWGFDHEVAAEAAEMESKEIQILDRLGFSNPYA
jgi:probable rRNA maturation factor